MGGNGRGDGTNEGKGRKGGVGTKGREKAHPTSKRFGDLRIGLHLSYLLPGYPAAINAALGDTYFGILIKHQNHEV
jgi:hypothetical protein